MQTQPLADTFLCDNNFGTDLLPGYHYNSSTHSLAGGKRTRHTQLDYRDRLRVVEAYPDLRLLAYLSLTEYEMPLYHMGCSRNTFGHNLVASDGRGPVKLIDPPPCEWCYLII